MLALGGTWPDLEPVMPLPGAARLHQAVHAPTSAQLNWRLWCPCQVGAQPLLGGCTAPGDSTQPSAGNCTAPGNSPTHDLKRLSLRRRPHLQRVRHGHAQPVMDAAQHAHDRSYCLLHRQALKLDGSRACAARAASPCLGSCRGQPRVPLPRLE